MNPTASRTLRTVRTRGRAVDVVLLLAVPVVLVGVHLLPREVRLGLAFSAAAPSLPSAYAAHFVHRSTSHLLSSLLVYALVVPTGYVLAALGDRRRPFLLVCAIVVSAVPFALSALHLVLLGEGIVVGFSGLALAFVGVLPLVLPGFLERFSGRVRVRHMPVMFFAGATVIAVRSLPAGRTRAGITLVTGLVAAGYAVALWRDLRSVDVSALVHRPGEFELAVGAPLLFFFALLTGFPTDPTRGTAVVNLYGHVLGYGMGFVVAYVVFQLEGDGSEPRIPPPESAV